MKYISVLRPATYQMVPLLKLMYSNLDCVLISDGVGVGKTISASYALVFLSNYLNQSGLVVCPPSLVVKWKQELESKFSFKAIIVTDKEELATMEYELLSERSRRVNVVYIIPSSFLSKCKLSDKVKLSVIIYDEIHSFRNNETIGYRAARSLAKHAKFRIGLSATPINNTIDDLVSELSILRPLEMWDAISTTIDDLWTRNKDTITNPVVTRFTKENLGIHFAHRNIKSYQVSYPAKYVQKIREIVSRLSTSDSFFEKVVYYRLAASSSEAFRKSTGIKNILIEVDPKISIVREILNTIKLEKWVIFCEFTETLRTLERELSNSWNIFVMTGDTPLFERQSIIDEFRESSRSLILLTPVGAEGLDFQFCNGVINYDLHWNPMKIEQRIGRVDRIGQKKDQIFVVNLIVNGSIDERVLEVIERKLSLISNSVFQISSLVRSKSRARIRNIFDPETFEAEAIKGKNLLRSLKYWESIPTYDYQILSNINIKYCDVKELADAARKRNVKWFVNEDLSESWIKKIENDSEIIRDRIKFYS